MNVTTFSFTQRSEIQNKESPNEEKIKNEIKILKDKIRDEEKTLTHSDSWAIESLLQKKDEINSMSDQILRNENELTLLIAKRFRLEQKLPSHEPTIQMKPPIRDHSFEFERKTLENIRNNQIKNELTLLKEMINHLKNRIKEIDLKEPSLDSLLDDIHSLCKDSPIEDFKRIKSLIYREFDGDLDALFNTENPKPLMVEEQARSLLIPFLLQLNNIVQLINPDKFNVEANEKLKEKNIFKNKDYKNLIQKFASPMTIDRYEQILKK